MRDEPEKPAPWCFVTADQEVLQGNRAGLENLRAAIDRALESGEGRIKTTTDDLTRVQCLDVDPRLARPEIKAKWQNRIGCVAGVAVFLTVLFLAALGVVFIWQRAHG